MNSMQKSLKMACAVLVLAALLICVGPASAAPAAPLAVATYVSDDVGGTNNTTNRATVDTLDDVWRSTATAAGASGFQQIALSGATDDPKTIWTSSGGFTVQASNREMNNTDLTTANSIGTQNGAYDLSNSSTLQDSALRPASLYVEGAQPLFWNQTGGSTSTRNAILFTFSAPITAFGAWFGDLETRTDGSGVAAILRLLDGNGNRIGSDLTVTTSTASQSSCGGSFVGCGNSTTKWIGFIADSSTPVKQMLIVVGDDDSGGNALAERISFIGATVALGAGSEPLAVALAALAAAATPSGVTLAWETVSEVDNAGFNIYRADAEAGPWARLNAALIPAAAPGTSAGHSYTWTDATAQPNTAYVYHLEAVALDGTTAIMDVAGVTYRPAQRRWLPLAR